MDNQPNQTPLGILNHLCSVSKVPMPSFEFEQIQNNENEYLFTCKCFINEEFHSVSKAHRKKTAKHLAAYKILKMLKENSSNSEFAAKLELLMVNMNFFSDNHDTRFDEINNNISKNSSSNNEIDLEISENSEVDLTKLESIKHDLSQCKNPVGELMIIADKYSMKQPVFIIEDLNEGLSPNQFSCEVKFGKFSERAIGRTKKLAKRYASIKLLFKIKTSGMLDNYPLKAKSYHKNETNKKKLLYEQLKFSNKKAISIIKSKNFKSNQSSSPILLEQLAKEENFEYEITNISSNFENSSACLIYVKTSPELVFGGYGKNQDEALNNSIYFLLFHLKEACTNEDI